VNLKAWAGISGWGPASETRYLYDGRLVLQERDANNLPAVSYTRGPDLSGSRQGAGGIGGLLARTDHGSGQSAFYHADGNGNITALVNAQQLVVARYTYDPFGNVLSKAGPLADANLYRFSSKEYHQPSGLVYYLYRFYDSNLQRWVNRDPIEEEAGPNLYAFVFNSPMDHVDSRGLEAGYIYNPDGSMTPPRGCDRAFEDAVDDLIWLYNKYIDPEPPPGCSVGVVPSIRCGARALTKVPGTYRVCLKNAKVYVGKAQDIYERLKQHVYRGKWKWEDIKRIFVEEEKSAARRSQRELERLMEETGGKHPADVDDVLNRIKPPK
jgi:RHS repeat-associated protein